MKGCRDDTESIAYNVLTKIAKMQTNDNKDLVMKEEKVSEILARYYSLHVPLELFPGKQDFISIELRGKS